MDILELFVLIGTIVNLSALIGAVLFRKRLIVAIGRLLFGGAVKFVRATYFDEVVQDGGDGKKIALLRPNAKLEASLKALLPGMMDLARRNVKITLPAFNLPEGVDLKSVGASVLAQKALSGKKLKLEDAIPMALGYGLEFLQKMGLPVGGKKPVEAGKEAAEANPFLKEVVP